MRRPQDKSNIISSTFGSYHSQHSGSILQLSFVVPGNHHTHTSRVATAPQSHAVGTPFLSLSYSAGTISHQSVIEVQPKLESVGVEKLGVLPQDYVVAKSSRSTKIIRSLPKPFKALSASLSSSPTFPRHCAAEHIRYSVCLIQTTIVSALNSGIVHCTSSKKRALGAVFYSSTKAHCLQFTSPHAFIVTFIVIRRQLLLYPSG